MGTGESDVDCNETIERLYHYLDGELTDERRQEIKHHLDDCPPCLDAFDFESELRQVIADRCKDRVPDALRERIRLALIEAERERDRTGS
ncbi:MAG TPA: mycothiol system anti-sigma-R factor [Acidimicrobiales bacterium]|nr:mycothiol system anti-sigma-R factor [Acidimicrobiales bacterium]